MIFVTILAVGACGPSDVVQNSPDSAQTLAGADDPYVRYHPDDLPTPDTWSIAAFSLREGCLVLTTSEGDEFIPILPASSTVSAAGGRLTVRIGQSELQGGRNYRLKGGEGQYATPDASTPRQCPARQFIVGEVL